MNFLGWCRNILCDGRKKTNGEDLSAFWFKSIDTFTLFGAEIMRNPSNVRLEQGHRASIYSQYNVN